MRGPTDRQAALAARQLHYHRGHLRWVERRISENEILLRRYLAGKEEQETVLPGGYLLRSGVAGGELVSVTRLEPEGPYEQLELPVVSRDAA